MWRTISPPPRQEWEKHKRQIATLYEYVDCNKPLEGVRNIMKERHGLDATRRMYQHRFRVWGIFKNMKRSEKDELLRHIEQNGVLALSDFSVREASIRPRTLSKLQRHLRDRQNEQPKEGVNQEILVHTLQGDGVSEPPFSRGIVLSNQRPTRDYQPAAPEETLVGTKVLIGGSCISDERTTRVSKTYCSNVDESSTSSKCTLAKDLDQDRSFFHYFLPSPARRMRPNPQGFQIDLVMHNVRSLCRLELEKLRGMGGNGALVGSKPSYEVSQFWNNTAQAFYLLKISAPHRAWPTLQKTLQVPARIVAAHPLNFLKELFSTLSPTNTRISSQARMLLLNHLTNTGLGPWHPVTVITSQLLKDNHDQEVSKEILFSIHDILKDVLGWKHDLALKLRRALIILLRRSLDLDAAGDMAEHFLHATQQEFGPGSLQARIAATELAHVQVDKREYHAAAKLSLSVVGVPGPTQTFVGPSFHDDKAVYAMEDLANIHSKLDEIEQSVVWLEKAAHDAWDLWGDNIATVYIYDKLDPLLRRCGRIEDADWYQNHILSNR